MMVMMVMMVKMFKPCFPFSCPVSAPLVTAFSGRLGVQFRRKRGKGANQGDRATKQSTTWALLQLQRVLPWNNRWSSTSFFFYFLGTLNADTLLCCNEQSPIPDQPKLRQYWPAKSAAGPTLQWCWDQSLSNAAESEICASVRENQIYPSSWEFN